MARRRAKSKAVATSLKLSRDDVSFIINEATTILIGRNRFQKIASKIAIDYILGVKASKDKIDANRKEVVRLSNGVEYYPPMKRGNDESR